MHVKLPKVKGLGALPIARAAVAHSIADNGMPWVTVNVSAENPHGFPSVVASLRMSVEEAQRFRAKLDEEIAKAIAGATVPPSADCPRCGRILVPHAGTRVCANPDCKGYTDPRSAQ